MTIGIVGLLAGFALLVSFVVFKITNQGRLERRRAIDLVLASRGGNVSEIAFYGETYAATSHGHQVICRFVTRSSGDSVVPWIEAQVYIAITTFEMDVRRRNLLSRLASSTARAIDIELGDAVFDRAYIVEAAPAEVARAVLDASTREWLLRDAPAGLKTTDRGLLFEKPGSIEDATGIRSTFEALGRVATLIGPAVNAACDDTRPALEASVTSGYRGPALPVIPTAAAERHAAELARFHDVRRWRAGARAVLIALGVLLVALSATWLAVALSKR